MVKGLIFLGLVVVGAVIGTAIRPLDGMSAGIVCAGAAVVWVLGVIAGATEK
jgi:hypothetical protein